MSSRRDLKLDTRSLADAEGQGAGGRTGRLWRRLREAGPGVAIMIASGRALTAVSRAWCTAVLKLKLRLVGATYGPHLVADGRVIVRARRPGAIVLGDHVTFKSRVGSNLVGLTGPVVLDCSAGGRIVIGDHSGCSGAVLSSRSSIEIGRHVNIGGNARIYDHDFHSLDAQIRREPWKDYESVRTEPVTLGDDVFVGAHAIVLKGVRAGAGAVIGAGSVVSLREIPAGAVVTGNPASVRWR
jgi:acetyltransferase-like isoleucine patch superfamily enzyme